MAEVAHRAEPAHLRLPAQRSRTSTRNEEMPAGISRAQVYFEDLNPEHLENHENLENVVTR